MSGRGEGAGAEAPATPGWGLTVRTLEKCFDGTRHEYLEEGERWARVQKARVEECECAGGRIVCADTAGAGRRPTPSRHPSPCPSHLPLPTRQSVRTAPA